MGSTGLDGTSSETGLNVGRRLKDNEIFSAILKRNILMEKKRNTWLTELEPLRRGSTRFGGIEMFLYLLLVWLG